MIVSSANSYPKIDPERNRELNEKCEGSFWEGLAEAGQKVDEIGKMLTDLTSEAEKVVIPLLRLDV